MIGLALQGGGARGAYQAGAILALKKLGIKYNGVCGTSIGAFNGALAACKKEKELVEFWESIDLAKILDFDEDFITKMNEAKHDLKYYQLGIKNFVKILKAHGLNINGLEKVIDKYVTEEELKKSPIDYGICTIRLRDLKPLYIFKEDMLEGKLYDYVLASCYLPIFKMEKKVDDHYYLDGGFYDNTPLNMLIEKGYKKIYVIELKPLININRKPKKNIEIIRIAPKRSIGGVLNFNLESTREIIKMGYYDTLREIKKLDGYHYCFKNHPEFIYDILVRKIPHKELNNIKGFFNVKTKKAAIIKSLEYIMKNEHIDYYQVYSPLSMLKNIQKNYSKDHFVYNFIRKIKIL